VIAVAALVVGLAVGWLITMIVNSAAISYSQERMERKVRYWQAEAAKARVEAKAARMARQSEPPHDPPPKGGGWPWT
jgi:uncharacterized membrane-anchored protein YhcB (DUF1043 family)